MESDSSDVIKKIKNGFKLRYIILVALTIIATLLYRKENSPSLKGDFLPVLSHFKISLYKGRYIIKKDGEIYVLTLDKKLQRKASFLLKRYKVPFGVVCAIDPKTGKILALAQRSKKREKLPLFVRATFPGASLFKLVTAAAALEKGVLSPKEKISYRGNPYRVSPYKIFKTKGGVRVTFREALGKSYNVVFAKISVKLLGANILKKYAQAFYFNRTIPFEYRLAQSRAFVPKDPYKLAKFGAGLDPNITINPIHAALIAQAIANDGVLMRPYIVKSVIDKNGRIKYVGKSKVLGKVIERKTACALKKMMVYTILDGTASLTFRRIRKLIRPAGKTGSLSGGDPFGRYAWFIGFAPFYKPKIVICAMVVDDGTLRVKANFLAKELFLCYFGLPKRRSFAKGALHGVSSRKRRSG